MKPGLHAKGQLVALVPGPTRVALPMALAHGAQEVLPCPME